MQNHWDKFLNNKDTSEAFACLYNLYVNDMLSYGVSLGFDDATSRDAIHDVFFKMYKDKDKLSHVENVKSYLFRSFRNRLFNIHNKSSRTSPISDEEIPFTTNVTILDTIISKEELEKLKQTVSDILAELTPRQREAIYLRYMQEMDYKEIGELLKMDSNSARRLVHRGIKALRENESISRKHLFIIPILLAYHF